MIWGVFELDELGLVEQFIATTADADACTRGSLDIETLATMSLEDRPDDQLARFIGTLE
jgi:hypothetical protein